MEENLDLSEDLQMRIAELRANQRGNVALAESEMMDDVRDSADADVDRLIKQHAADKASMRVAEEAAFNKGFKNVRSSEFRAEAPKANVESFARQVNKAVKQGDAGGEGRTQNAPPVKTIPASHEIKPDDTMWALAKRYGISVEEIQRLNEGVDPRRMQLGSVLRLTDAPAPQVAPQAAQRPVTPMVNFDPRADAITPVAPVESLIGGLGAAKVAKGASGYLQKILANKGAQPAAPAQADRFRAMDEMARRGPPVVSPGRSYPNEAAPSWLVKGRR
jgi:LysM repeat protein